MAIGQSKWLKLDDNDTVVFSSHPIPGMRLRSPPCATARSARRPGRTRGWSISTSGHGKQQELKTLRSVTQCQVVRAGAASARIWSPTEISPATWECRPIEWSSAKTEIDRAR